MQRIHWSVSCMVPYNTQHPHQWEERRAQESSGGSRICIDVDLQNPLVPTIIVTSPIMNWHHPGHAGSWTHELTMRRSWRKFETEGGVKIPRSTKRCLEAAEQCSQPQAAHKVVVEDSGLEKHCSVPDLLVRQQRQFLEVSSHKKIRWPRIDKSAWRTLVGNISIVLDCDLKGNMQHRLSFFSSIV